MGLGRDDGTSEKAVSSMGQHHSLRNKAWALEIDVTRSHREQSRITPLENASAFSAMCGLYVTVTCLRNGQVFYCFTIETNP